MCWTKMAAIRGTFYVPELAPINMVSWRHTPAWSLHRLMEMIGDMFEMQHWLGFNIEKDYDHTIDCIEWLIDDKRFNKEYLEEEK